VRQQWEGGYYVLIMAGIVLDMVRLFTCQCCEFCVPPGPSESAGKGPRPWHGGHDTLQSRCCSVMLYCPIHAGGHRMGSASAEGHEME